MTKIFIDITTNIVIISFMLTAIPMILPAQTLKPGSKWSNRENLIGSRFTTKS